MENSVIGTILTQLEGWFEKLEDSKEGDDTRKMTIRGIAVSSLFTPISLIINLAGSDPDNWRVVSEWVKQQRSVRRALEVHGCLDILTEIGSLFTK